MNENKVEFLKLTPDKNTDISIYKDAIDFVFDENNQDIRNIAISGSYGSGKSSVLESYELINSDKKFIHISLAHFEVDVSMEIEQGDNLTTENNSNEDMKASMIGDIALLEGKILNQLIHQIPYKNINQTDFNLKKKVTKWDILKILTPLSISIISFVHILKFETWSEFINSLPENYHVNIIEWSTKSQSKLLSGILLSAMFSYFLWQIILAQKTKSIFKKLNIQGNEIEILAESKESFFDKYLNEVIYLFKNSGVDAIVFEDIDRYDEIKIFERLREINTLINSPKLQKNTLPKWIKSKYQALSKRKTIKFFYLIRDDIFISKDRTKFFDYIMPVIPIVDSSNSYDKIIEAFEKSSDDEIKLDEHFLQNISLYIDDMRLLKNIYNEFVIYKNRLSDTELDIDTIFAMITYKNIFPRDFADLQLNRGFVYTLFKSKDELTKEQKNDLETNIEMLLKKIKTAEDEIVQTTEELFDIYSKKLERCGYGTNYEHERYESTIANKYGKNDYAGRLDAIENIINKGKEKYIKNLTSQVQKCRNRISDLNEFGIKEVLTDSDIDAIFKTVYYKNEINETDNFVNIKKNGYFDLLKYLIIEGYLNENSSDYMTYFGGKSICKQDKDFILSVLNRRRKEYSYNIKESNKVLDRLSIIQFDQLEILNFDLYTHLLKNDHLSEKLDRFIKQLETTKNIEFIGLFLDKCCELPSFIKTLNHNWSSFFTNALECGNFTEKQQHEYSIFTLYYSDDEDIAKVNTSNCLAEFISNKKDYLNIESPNVEKSIAGFKLLNVSFSQIDRAVSNISLLKEVYEHDMYDLNIENINMMIDIYYGNYTCRDKNYKNYSIILEKQESPLAKYVDRNISEYVELVLLNCGGFIQDLEFAASNIINNANVTKGQTESYINKLTILIPSIDAFCHSEYWELLLSQNKAKYTINNIMAYFLNKTNINDTLIAFIHSDVSKLEFNLLNEKYTEVEKEKLFDNIVICNNLDDQKYKEIVVDLGFHYDNFDVCGITETKLKILIDEKIINLTEISLVFIRTEYANVLIDYILSNIQKYSEIMTASIFDFDEFIRLLPNNDISVDIRLSLLQFTDEKISIISNDYPTEIVLALLNQNLETTDIPHLFSKYESYCKDIKDRILNIALARLPQVQNKSIKAPYMLIADMISNEALNISQKTNVLIAYLNLFDSNEISKLLHIMELNELHSVLNSTDEIQLEVNSTNEMLLEAFKNQQMIFDYEHISDVVLDGEIESEVNYYKVNKNRPLASELDPVLL